MSSSGSKPNVLLAGWAVVLTDFGIARAVSNWKSRQDNGTGRRSTWPRNRSMALAEITPATDIYALGVTLFEMLT